MTNSEVFTQEIPEMRPLFMICCLFFLMFFLGGGGGGGGEGEGHISDIAGHSIEVGVLSPLRGCGTYVTIFTKTTRLARKSIIVYARKYSFKLEDANEKEARLPPKVSIM